MRAVRLAAWYDFIQQECDGIKTGILSFPNRLDSMQNKALNSGEAAAIECYNSHMEEVEVI